MNNPQPFTTVHTLQLEYELALRDLDPCIEALIDALEASVDCIRNPDEYHQNKDQAETKRGKVGKIGQAVAQWISAAGGA